MGFTNYYEYDGELEADEWKRLVTFSKLAADTVEGTVCKTTVNYIDITGNPGCENLVLHRTNSARRREFYGQDAYGNVRGFCKTARQAYDKVVVAVLIAAKQAGLISQWSSDGDTEEVRPGVELYYQICDNFTFSTDGRQWWEAPPRSHAKEAAAFHTKWKSLEPDLMNLAAAAQALAAIGGGSTTLVQLLEELNDILIDKYNLTARPFNEDPECVRTSGMLEAWRSALFDLVVTREEC